MAIVVTHYFFLLVPPGTTPRLGHSVDAAARVLVLKVVCCAAGVRVRQPVHVLQAACCAKGRAAVFCGRLPSALREGMRNLLYYVIIIVPRDRSPPLGGVSQNFVVLTNLTTKQATKLR